MNTAQNKNTTNQLAGMFTTVSIVLLILDFYFYSYNTFEEWHLTFEISNRLLLNIAKMGLYKNPFSCKLWALLFVVLTIFSDPAKKDGKVGYSRSLIFICIGLSFYFGSTWLIDPNADIPTGACLYMALTIIGYLLILSGGMRLTKIMGRSSKDFFAENLAGFRQEGRLIRTPHALNFPAQYFYNGKTRKSFINIINPRRGVLIMGSPGAGKSWFIIEPAIDQLIKKGMALLVYDFKYPTLTRVAYESFIQNKDNYPPATRFYSINFTDLSASHRCNLIDPLTLESLSDAIGVSKTILLSMNKTWVHRQGEFFVESPINFLAALIWFLRIYNDGIYCTLPHVIELARTPYEELFTILNVQPSINTLADPFIQAYKNKTMEMLDGQISSAKIPLGRLASPDLYYILTGSDLTLDINNPDAPSILCLGGDPARQEALAPVLSLYIDRLNKLINKPQKHSCGIVLDEFATVRAAAVLTTLSTARSNNIIPILSVQDLSQLKTLYSNNEAEQIMNITGNLICGQVGGETARWVSERFPPTMQYHTTISVNSSDTSTSKSEHTAGAMSPSIIATLSSGEFVGIVADDPTKKMEHKAFHATVVKRDVTAQPAFQLPEVRQVGPSTIEENFHRIKEEVKDLVKSEMKRILADPKLRHLIVKK